MTVSSCCGMTDAEKKLWFLSMITLSKYEFRFKNGVGIIQLAVILKETIGYRINFIYQCYN